MVPKVSRRRFVESDVIALVGRVFRKEEGGARLTRVSSADVAQMGSGNSRQTKTGFGVHETCEKTFDAKSCTGQIM